MKQQMQSTEPDSTGPAAFVPIDVADRLDVLTAENEQLRSELRLRSARDSLLSAFAKENARSPELLFQASAGRFEFDEHGALTNTEELTSELLQKFPEQFGSDDPRGLPDQALKLADAVVVPPLNAGAGRGRPHQTITKESLAKMSPQEISRLDWNDVKHVLSS